MNAQHFESQKAFRKWLEKNHDKVTELFVRFYRKDTGRGGMTYKEAVDEALCFGWIDGVRKRLDDESFSQRFTPRKKKSYWSAVNTKRFEELHALGAVAPPGQPPSTPATRRKRSATHSSARKRKCSPPSSKRGSAQRKKRGSSSRNNPPATAASTPSGS
jgi:hypothetical protein